MNASDQTRGRKDDHIRLALEQQPLTQRSEFDDIEFVHHALSGINREEVRLETRVADQLWASPLYVNAMTGGTDRAAAVNRALAEAAAETGTTIASGSLGIALDHPETAASFTVLREANPNGVVIANIGAGRSEDDAHRAVELLDADALQIHVNAVQETVMPEGSRRFGTWLEGIESIVTQLTVPVIVKEVGFGLSKRTLRQLREIGVEIADVSGTGGTNFAEIEAARRDDGFTDLNRFGQSTAACLLDVPRFPTVLASGGVRTPLDVVKALALGARGVGVAGRILAVAKDGDADAVRNELEWFGERIVELLALLGAPTPAALTHTDLLIRGRVREFCELRGIDAAAFSRRSPQ